MTTNDERNIRKIINNFINNVDNKKQYTLKQLDKKLETSYNTYIPNTDTNKKPPSAYNMYIKERMAKLKSENSALTAKELMKMAATGWGEYKKSMPEQPVAPAPETTIKGDPTPTPASTPEPMAEAEVPITPESVKVDIPNAPKKAKNPKKKQ